MCQNNFENRTHNHPYAPFPKHPISIHPPQKQQPLLPPYEKHIVKVQLQEVDAYCTMLQGRLNNKNPYINNVLSFQILPQKQSQYLNSRETVEILVCTDKMFPLGDQDWSKDNLVKILLGLKRLCMVYGPFAVSPQQICKNEHE